jgi:hypothetical protein
MTEEQEGKPKIVVDSNWKEQVQAEKEAAQQSPKDEPTPEESASQLPPATFPLLVSSLATQALMTMGQIPDPEGKASVELDHAKHTIDMLEVLDEKTKGNLTTEEAAMMQQVLHQIRMVYVAVAKNPTAAPDLFTPGED